MKIGNLSQSIVKSPEFFKNENSKKIEIDAFNVLNMKKRKDIFRESDFFNHQSSLNLNYNRNFRHYYVPKKIIKKKNTQSNKDYPISMSNTKIKLDTLSDMEKFEIFKNCSGFSKLSSDEFTHSVKMKELELLKRINNSRYEENTHQEINLFKSCKLGIKFPILTEPFHKKTPSVDKKFHMTLKNKIISMRTISPSLKSQIIKRKSNIQTAKDYEEYINPTLSFRDTIRFYLRK